MIDSIALQTHLEEVMEGAPAAVTVMRHGDVLADIQVGQWSSVADHPLVFGFSLTKGIAATVIAWLVGNGELDYGQTIASAWPAFGQHGKSEITLGMVLTHRAGLSAIPEWLEEHPQEYTNAEAIEAVLADTIPNPDQLGTCAYHALTFGWILNGFIRHAFQTDFAELAMECCADLRVPEVFLRSGHVPEDSMLEPLQQVVPVPEAVNQSRDQSGIIRGIRSRSATRAALGGSAIGLQTIDPTTWDTVQPALVSLSSSIGLASLYATLADPEHQKLHSAWGQARSHRCDARDAVIGFPMYWQGGYQATISTNGYEHHVIGHRGYGGSGGWVDIESGTACAFMTPHMSATPFMDMRFAEVTSAVLDAIRN